MTFLPTTMYGLLFGLPGRMMEGKCRNGRKSHAKKDNSNDYMQ
jgi:hypothetical protein